MVSLRCAYCRAKLDLGRDALAVVHGVVGPRGFIPLEEPVLLCSEACLARFVVPPEEAPRRLP